MRLLILALVLVLASGCGSGDGTGGGGDEITVRGSVRADAVGAVKQEEDDAGMASSVCSLPGFEDRQVVISDSTGKNVGLAEIADVGTTDPLDEPGYFGGVPGTCNLEWTATVPKSDGFYLAEIDGVAGKARFNVEFPDHVVIQVRAADLRD